MPRNLINIYSDKANAIADVLKNGETKIFLKGLAGSSETVNIASFYRNRPGNLLVILNNREEAAYFYNDINKLLGKDYALFFPGTYKRSPLYEGIDNENIVLRTEILSYISGGSKKIVVSFPDAICEKVVSRKVLKSKTIRLHTGQEVDMENLISKLNSLGFQRNDFVYAPGEFSVRGSIIDVFSYSNNEPFRIDFFDNEIESIRYFNVQNQLSTEKVDDVSIVADTSEQVEMHDKKSLFDFLPDTAVVWVKDYLTLTKEVDDLHRALSEKYEKEEAESKISNFIDAGVLKNYLNKSRLIEFGFQNSIDAATTINYECVEQPAFNKNFEILTKHLKDKQEQNYSNYILTDNDKQEQRLKEIFASIDESVSFKRINTVLHEGFIDNEKKICCYTDHQIFERYHKFKLKKGFSKRDSLSISEINNLNPGDYVVHTDHGIGKFVGLNKIEVNGKMQEAIRLVYKDNDIIFVNIHSLHKISKYKSGDAEPPKINKLGTGAWQKIKTQTKKKVKDIAKDLIALYAERMKQEAFKFSEDTYMQHELESSFIYEDTPDQIKSNEAVKADMEADYPMDRLVCGDVGFGKTEIAVRAAFKAVADSKQVVVLVPTTILALQHYKTFSERLDGFPCNVDYLTRLRSTKDRTRIQKELESGKIDIIIGTHKLVSKSVKFKDIGLLIIDEEQKFGVSVKEKIRGLRANIDTLTLTATPIPRTLQFSLMGARDLSIINTPPPNRYPIITELHSFNEDIIRESLNYEIDRGGQVFFIHNRVQNIKDVEFLVNKICPGAKTVTAHGQMEGGKLEKIMLDFIEGHYDVLIATTIIESGIDVPNANTMIINNAQNFGLSDLHQLRGRVGRSNKKAFCYLLAPPLSALTINAKKRLKAIESFSELGSGFNISMQDLDIRGAGNLLGAEQSGFIADIGFETYKKILDEAILELKDNEYKSLFNSDKVKEKEERKEPVKVHNHQFIYDCNIETDLELRFPDYYVENTSERIKLYRELDNIEKSEDLEVFKSKLTDRFGELPSQAEELLNIVKLRRLALNLAVERMIIKNGKMVAYFVSNPESSFYSSPVFTSILSYLQQNPANVEMKENKEKLYLRINNIKNISQIISIFEKILS